MDWQRDQQEGERKRRAAERNEQEEKRLAEQAERDRQEAERKRQEALGHLANANNLIAQGNWLAARDALNAAIEVGDLPEARQKLQEIRPQIATAEAQAYKASCQNIPYNQLEKDADRLIGTKVHYYGKIFNIRESDGTTMMQVNVTNKGWDIWDDQVMVAYEGHVDVYEDDKVHFWGEVAGTESYESVAGWNISVPKVIAEYVEK